MRLRAHKTKITATVGPASASAAVMEDMIRAGMDIARLNFSHGGFDDHGRNIENLRAAARAAGRDVAILADLPGPKIRLGAIAGDSIELVAGQPWTLTTEEVVGDATRAFVSFPELPRVVKAGDRLFVNDGLVHLEVEAVSGPDVRCRVVVGGEIRSRKGVNLPGLELGIPAFTDHDRRCLEFALRHGVDVVSQSFVESAADVERVRVAARELGHEPFVIAKIERARALDRADEILAAADGIMVARGDLGVELGPEKVPLWQKRIIEETNRRGKIVITATQMLESMITQPRPTRAEASDVANAVLDGTDALMLSAESASGLFPVEAVRTMARIIDEIERSAYYRANVEAPDIQLAVPTNAIAHAAITAARAMRLKTIVVVSESGGAARLVSEYRPDANIVSLTTNEVSFRRLALFWGVTPVLISPAATTEELIDRVEATLIERNLALPGENVLITMAVPVGSGMQTNVLKIHEIQH